MHTFHLSPAFSGSFGRHVAFVTTGALDWARSAFTGVARLSTTQEPRNATEVLAWARSVESVEPGLAADLRAAALRALD
jgi:hypothetical protein